VTLKEFRLSQGLSQKALASSIGCSVGTISTNEQNKRKISRETLSRIRMIYGVEIDENTVEPDVDETAESKMERKSEMEEEGKTEAVSKAEEENGKQVNIESTRTHDTPVTSGTLCIPGTLDIPDVSNLHAASSKAISSTSDTPDTPDPPDTPNTANIPDFRKIVLELPKNRKMSIKAALEFIGDADSICIKCKTVKWSRGKLKGTLF